MEEAICNPEYLKDIQSDFNCGKEKSLFQLDGYLHKSFPLQLHRIEESVKAFKGTIPPHHFSHHFLALITKGKGEKVIGCHRFEVRSGMALIIPAYRVHATPGWDLNNQGYMLSFEESFPFVILLSSMII